MKKIQLIVLMMLLFGSGLFAQRNFFQAVSAGSIPQAREATKQVSKKGVYTLDEKSMRNYLLNAPMEFRNNGATIPLIIPLPDGTTETFNIVESPVLSAKVAAGHPEIKTYTGNGQKDKKAVIRISLTSSGLSAIILNMNGDAVYFEPYSSSQPGTYFNYFVKDIVIPFGGVHRKPELTPQNFSAPSGMSNRASSPLQNQRTASTGSSLTTYRLAMPADAEFVAHNGGTKTSGFNAVVAYVNRIILFYRNELSVSFTLVSDSNVIYTDATTDPYSNDSQSTMLGENISNCNAVYGVSGYDIGHVWGYVGGSGGGIAYLQSLGQDDSKGGGVSGEGDLADYAQVFMDQLVFHEMGHQFGMTHTYNSSIPVCTTRAPATSVEPGSGATIMSYGFTCGDDDYFTTSAPQTGPILAFHTVSYSQSVAYLATIPSIGVTTSTGNTAPVVTVPSNYTIPKSTPFSLTGSATDVNGDALTYSWEGTNIGTMTPDGTTLANTAQPPFFRTYDPSTSPTRYYPLLDSILSGSNYSKGDKLPSVGIVTTHTLTVRDNHASGGGVSTGSVTVTVDGNIGPFLITSNLAAAYAGNSTQTITWSVNGTSTATQNVKISLSTDGGHSFPTVLLASTPNDGTQAVTLPNITTTTARIKVEAVGNIFFDISNSNFSINSVATTYAITATSGTNGTVTPAGTTNIASGGSQTYTITPATCYQIASVLVDGAAVATAGTYTFSNVTASHTISASFSLRTYAITASSGANGTVTPTGATSVNCGASQTYTITPASGYAIQSVLVDGAAVATAGTYTFTNVSATHTISATFALNAYSITATSGANGTVTPAGATNVASGGSQTYTITPATCYQIASVLVDGAAVATAGTYTFNNVTASHTISASFSLRTYAITASSGANGTVTPAGATNVNCGASQTYTITPASGYAIQSVLVDGAAVATAGTYTFTNVSATHTISATFALSAYSITATSGANGTVTPAGATNVASGGSQTYTITPAACYQIASVLVDGAAVATAGTYTFSNVTASHTISASFSLRTYAITASSGANGTVTPTGATSVNCGASQTYTITPASGYAIQSVLVDGAAVATAGTYTFTNVSATHTISATFALNAYSITATSGANGTVTPAGATNVASGGSQTYTITPAACYQIASVLVDGAAVATAGTYTFSNVTASHTISASFSLRTYAITATSGANGTVTPTGATSVNCGASQTYTITPASGYAIQSVLVDGAAVATAGTYTFTNVSATHTISATFIAGATTTAYRVNAGGPTVTNSIGTFTSDNAYFSPTPGYTSSTAADILGTTDDAIYQTERYSVTNELNYAFPVANGSYKVILHFAEIYLTGKGQRVFDVSIENVKVLDDYDILKKVNPNTATTETFTTNVTDGSLNIYFSSLAKDGGSNSPKVSAIEILQLSTNTAPTANAGPDQTISLPTSSATLSGSGTDVGGSIAGYTWSQVSGPNNAVFNNAAIASPTVSGLIAGSYWFSLVVTDNQGATSPADLVLITVNAAGNTPLFRINAGGPQVTNSIGVFAADNYFSPTPGNTYKTTASIKGTSDSAIYQSERFSTDGVLNYAFPVPAGQYKVILHFAEIYLTGQNQRVFDVSIEGIKVLDNYDILKKVAPNTATTETFNTTVTDGTLNIYFSSLAADGGSNNAKVSAIEIIQTSANPAPVANAGPDQTITLPANSAVLSGSGTDANGGTIAGYTWSQVSGPNTATFTSTSVASPTVSGLIAGSYWFSLVVTDNQMAQSMADLVLITVNAAGNTPVYRVNAGGPQVTNSIGVFMPDAGYFSPTPGFTNSTTASIAGTKDSSIYQTERYSTTGVLNYAFPVTNGQYKVILHFAEIYLTQPNYRVFDVTIETTKVLDNYDILKKVAPNTATTETFTTNVADGVLNINFSSLAADGGSNSPKVSAIEIIKVASPTKSVAMPTVIQDPLAQKLSVTVTPNPAVDHVTFHITSGNSKTVFLRIFGADGKMIESRANLLPNGTVQIGNQYIPGLYYAEVLQGDERVTLKFIKLKN